MPPSFDSAGRCGTLGPLAAASRFRLLSCKDGPMSAIQLGMLWESDDPQAALRERFQFESPEAAAGWIAATLDRAYGISVESVDRLAISSYNLLAWLSTGAGPLLAKSCAAVIYHPVLQRLGEL